MDFFGRVREQFVRLAAQAGESADPLGEWLGACAARYGVEFSEELTTGQFTADLLPAPFRLDTSIDYAPVRYGIYNGVSVVPRWLWEEPVRPRVGFTLGLSAVERLAGYAVSVVEILKALAGLDVEVVAAVAAVCPGTGPGWICRWRRRPVNGSRTRSSGCSRIPPSPREPGACAPTCSLGEERPKAGLMTTAPRPLEGTNAQDRRVVVTGRGVVSPLAPNWPDTWAGLLAGKSGIGDITGFDVQDLPVRIGGEVPGFDPEAYLPRHVVRRTDWTIQAVVAAARMALREADIEVDDASAPRVGVAVGSIIGSTRVASRNAMAMRDEGYAAVSPQVFPTMGISSAAEVCLELGCRGPSAELVAACATGTVCVGEAAAWIREGRADVAVAGGMDAFDRLELAAAARARVLSRSSGDPAAASRPFDKGRDGFVMGAGAGVLVLESAAHARRRGATVLAEVAGYASTTDAHHLTAPAPDAAQAVRAMRDALAAARATPADVGYINAHGTGTRLNDDTELAAIRQVYADHAPRVPVSSTKSMTGHMLAAGGAVEAAVVTEVLRTGAVPPTLNCDDPEDPAMNFVAHTAQEHVVELGVSHSFGFGGHNAVLVLRRWRG
nr:beta-ketoacyl-ACP synthase II [Streptomyces aureocirculatus]